MVTPPNLRESAASGGAFPRWGYLDKFYANEYMARALVAAMLISLMGLGASRLGLGSASQPKPPRVHPFYESIQQFHYQPIPHIVPQPKPAPHVQPSWHDFGKPIPVDTAPAPVAERWVPGGPGSASGPGDGQPNVEPTGVSGVAPTVQPLPAFDEHIAVEKEPELVGMREPGYPEIARDAGIEGEVLVRVLVGSDGNVKDAVVVKSVLGLDEAAQEAARTAVFKPALQQGNPVAVWVIVPIEFRLRD